jgi:hypothetical protein
MRYRILGFLLTTQLDGHSVQEQRMRGMFRGVKVAA